MWLQPGAKTSPSPRTRTDLSDCDATSTTTHTFYVTAMGWPVTVSSPQSHNRHATPHNRHLHFCKKLFPR